MCFGVFLLPEKCNKLHFSRAVQRFTLPDPVEALGCGCACEYGLVRHLCAAVIVAFVAMPVLRMSFWRWRISKLTSKNKFPTSLYAPVPTTQDILRRQAEARGADEKEAAKPSGKRRRAGLDMEKLEGLIARRSALGQEVHVPLPKCVSHGYRKEFDMHCCCEGTRRRGRVWQN